MSRDVKTSSATPEASSTTMRVPELGPGKENVQGALRNGISPAAKNPRLNRGVDNERAKLTPEQVRAIRVASRITITIAADYGIAQSRVSAIRNGKPWKSLV
jgi:hypothetical protein